MQSGIEGEKDSERDSERGSEGCSERGSAKMLTSSAKGQPHHEEKNQKSCVVKI